MSDDVRVLSLHQPYSAGVVRGDGWVSPLSIGLRCKDREFAEAFADALAAGYGVTRRPALDERGYWLMRFGNKSGRFDALLGFVPSTPDEWKAWLRGMFDSEGNAQCLHRPSVSPAAYGRRVAFYSTDTETVGMLEHGLDVLGLPTKRGVQRLSDGHLGTRPVYEVRLAGNRDAYRRFAIEVGSSIPRKQAVLDAIPPSYQPRGHHVRAQKRGAAVRRARRDAGGSY